ncbi:13332_t:CDS:1, partial [Acaulospora colombiana]
MSTAEHSFAQLVLSSLCKQDTEGLFTKPIDPSSKNASDYLRAIEKPMDFGTIEKKLKLHEDGQSTDSDLKPYTTLQSFVDDVNLVFDNCFKYHGMAHEHSQRALRLKKTFEWSMISFTPGGK